jgi:ribonuclease P protein component
MRKTVTLNDNKDFVSLFKKGNRCAGDLCAAYYRKNNSRKNRLGIVTGKKLGNAVKRNRCRRIIRRAYAENENLFPTGYDIIVAARPPALTCKSTEISGFFKNTLIRKWKA